jgi:two-component system OmpR family response regulator
MTIRRILVVDDDEEIRELLTRLLTRHGYMVITAGSGAQLTENLQNWRVDLIILDIMLGRESGFDLCRRLRRDNNVPILMLTALSADEDRITGLELGADDYVVKPFNPDVLLARIKSLFRRIGRSPSLHNRRSRGRYHFEGWQCDLARRELISPDGHMVMLSHGEYALLALFLAAPNVPLRRDELAESGDSPADTGQEATRPGDPARRDRAIDMQIARLRHKLGDDSRHPRLIKTVRGLGYVFAVRVDHE